MSFRSQLLINAANNNVIIQSDKVVVSSKLNESMFGLKSDENQNTERPSANISYPTDLNTQYSELSTIKPLQQLNDSSALGEQEPGIEKKYQELLPVCIEDGIPDFEMVCAQDLYQSKNIETHYLPTENRGTVQQQNISNPAINFNQDLHLADGCDSGPAEINTSDHQHSTDLSMVCDQEADISEVGPEVSFSENIRDYNIAAAENSVTDQQLVVTQSSATGNEEEIVPKKKRAREAATMTENQRKKHPLLPSCDCKRRCVDKIPEDTRKKIWDQYWTLERQRRRDFLSRHVEKNRTAFKTTPGSSRRHNTLKWKMNDHQVCKIFFLHTLGYTNDEAVLSVLKCNFAANNSNPSVSAAPDPRGRHKPSNAFSEDYNERIKKHIMSYNPVKSHYNLKHAPNRLYLPVNINFSDMYKGFQQDCLENNLKVCSWTHFHNIIKLLNISTAEPAQDICTKCKTHEVKHKSLELPCNCVDCIDLGKHLYNKRNSKIDLNTVEKRCENNEEEVLYTVDMQKAICMPILNTKDYYFSRKLVLFNESFVPPGKNKTAVCILWHEGECGRKAYNIASAYIYVLRKYCRDMKHVHFFLDNCNAQNKNKVLFSALVRVVNDNMTCIEKVTLEYFEPGHTFMAADTVHGAIAKKFKSSGNVYDLDDFVEKIKQSRKNIEVDVINHTDMILICDDSKVSYPKGYNINNLKVIEFQRNKLTLFAKNDYRTDYQEIHFLKKKIETLLQKRIDRGHNDLLDVIPREIEPKGINARKKTDLMTLCQSLPATRKPFFENLRVDDDAPDLCQVIDAIYD